MRDSNGSIECVMKIVFRVDASTSIGAGHAMRCLSLANVLKERGAATSFVCREHEGHLCDLIEQAGFEVVRLPAGVPGYRSPAGPLRASWLGVPQSEDAVQTQMAIRRGARPDWLIVDHYALDRQWESALRQSISHIMAIDDLADRPHDCDLLLDQNFDNPRHREYARLVPAQARQLLGPQYALVRPEFLEQRDASLARRHGQVGRLMISMGGADPGNDTAKVLAGLSMDGLQVSIDVVVGQGNPWRHEISELCAGMPSARLHVQTPHMAYLMTQSDVAITGGGGTTWERCVLGLPAIVTIQSDDQAASAAAVQEIGGHVVLGWAQDLTPVHYCRAIRALTPDSLIRMSRISSGLCDGGGAERVANHLINWGLDEKCAQ